MTREQAKPKPQEDRRPQAEPQEGTDHESGSNAVEHEPDPQAKPIPDGEHKYIRRSPYTTGNY